MSEWGRELCNSSGLKMFAISRGLLIKLPLPVFNWYELLRLFLPIISLIFLQVFFRGLFNGIKDTSVIVIPC